jgi:Protein of unknown function (DUF3592)
MFAGSASSENVKIFLVVIGGCLGSAGDYRLFRNEALVEHGCSARGVVTRLVWSSGGGDTGGKYTPEFKFNASDGSTHVVMSGCGSTPCPFKVGQEIRVVYDPLDPARAEINTVGQLWFIPGLLTVVGLVMLGIGIGEYITPLFRK